MDNKMKLFGLAPIFGGAIHTIIELLGVINTSVSITLMDLIGGFAIGYVVVFISLLAIQIKIKK